MKRKTILLLAATLLASLAQAEDGHRLWLRYDTLRTARVEGAVSTLAAEELHNFYAGQHVVLKLDNTLADAEAYNISGDTLSARTDVGLLYGAYALLRGERSGSAPFFRLRILNHWDNLDSSIERGYAGTSIFWDQQPWSPTKAQTVREYARACASLGINGTVLNNVNASPDILTAHYLQQVKAIADVLRPYGLKVYLSVNFASPMKLGGLKTADPLNRQVQQWWKAKVKEVYRNVPDFGGFLVKANSEGQPGPGDYGRSHADGANMLADAVAPYGGIIMWRSFVYGARHKGEDRVKQAVSEFKGDDGKFRPNVILQSKNGPLDFQPREPYAPIFDQMTQTPQMAELQITQEYLGQSAHLVYLAPLWREFFSFVSPCFTPAKPSLAETMKGGRIVGMAGVANIGNDANWCGHHFAQANWYAFGRLAWNPALKSEQIASEWLAQTFESEEFRVKSEEFATAMPSPSTGLEGTVEANSSPFTLHSSLKSMLLRSREACVDYMMPLGLHHIFKFDHHYGPEPDGFKANYPLEWCPVYYHQADSLGVGFERSHIGTDATNQYREPYCSLYDDLHTCPENLLLWFHHVPWTYRTNSGRTLWEEMQYRYRRGVAEVEDFCRIWQEARPYIDEQRWTEVDERLQQQLDNAREWRDVCLRYFGSFQR